MKLSRTWLASVCAVSLIFAAHSTAAAVTGYNQDFESLDPLDLNALATDGWLVGANVFDPSGVNFLYNYFAFPAPNNATAFSGIDVNQGGPAQGNHQLVVYSDYENPDHGNGYIIESNVFQEQIISGGDVGSTWSFGFDAKQGNIEGASTALAFIKTVDPSAGYSLSNFVIVDMTSIGINWSSFEMSLFIDPSLDGQLLQFGFLNVASNFEGSGMFYDNISFSQVVPVPAAVWLLGSGLLGLVGLRRRQKS